MLNTVHSKNPQLLSRRNFIASAVALTAVSALKPRKVLAQSGAGAKFRLNYAPHFGMFKHHSGEDFLDQLQFMADEGFTAFEDNGMMSRPANIQEKIANKMQQLELEMGVFVAGFDFAEPNFVLQSKENTDMLVSRMKQAVETSKRVNAKWCTVVPGALVKNLEWDYQTANVIENLKRCAAVCEPSGLIMVLEPLNPWRDHPGLFLSRIPQAYQICKAVNSPSCKILNDLYHQQVTEGNLIPNMDMAWSEIAYFQTGDNPGRKEPTTGEIDYKNIFKHLHKKGYKGIIGMEHGNSMPDKKGERAVINAYRYCDSFEI